MTVAYELSSLNPEIFENLVNTLALRTLGLGATGFGPGADGGRDGYFTGQAAYPSVSEKWEGEWFIQSKFYKPGGTKSENKWLIDRVKEEIERFISEDSDRNWPDIWIIATNVDPSGKPETGSFDAIRKILEDSKPSKNVRLAIWGGRKILDLLALNPDIASYYGHFLTPGHVITRLYGELAALSESRATTEEIIRYFVVNQFSENIYTKLEQAGSSSDIRPAVYDLFIDLPYIINSTEYRSNSGPETCNLLATLSVAAAQPHRYSLEKNLPESWRKWARSPRRARVTLIKGGPGQGKSTIGQYLCQIHRAHLITASDGPNVTESVASVARTLKRHAINSEFWPTTARIPIQIELKEFAHWHSQRGGDEPRSVLAYLAAIVSKKISSEVSARSIKLTLSKQAWIIVFDGLDEVPNDYKDEVAREVIYFVNDTLVEIDADVLALCTSRPQGYSGQFTALDGAEVTLARLDPEIALNCARPLLRFGRGDDEGEKSIQILEAAIQSPNIQELMTTPLQAHIMAVVVRDGGRPPERRWRLFQSFYQVMKRRESLKGFKNPRIAELLQGEDRLLKAVHMRLGFVLHARAERSSGAHTALTRNEFEELVRYVVEDLGAENVTETVSVLMEATTERLVLVSTPDNGDKVRFDIRQLQEFFAAEYLYDGAMPDELAMRIETIGADAHWREVIHFLLSALIADRRTTELAIAISELRKINDGIDGSENSIYHRRTVPATLISARLLAEGVIEDDQKDRRNFKQLISDTGSIADLQALFPLMQLTSRNSKSWLISLLVERIETANPNEYVGALFLLGGLWPDSDRNFEKLTKALHALPVGITEVLIGNWSAAQSPRKIRKSHANQGKKLSNWVLVGIVEILNSDRWSLFSIAAVSQMFRILRSNSDSFMQACVENKIPENVARSLRLCIDIRESDIYAQKNDDELISCGLISAAQIEENWVNGRVPKELSSIDAKACVPFLSGVFRVLMTCLWFGKRRTKEALYHFVELYKTFDREYLAVIPKYILALVPVAGEHEVDRYSLDQLSNVQSNLPVKEVLQSLSERLSPPYDRYYILKSAESGDWTSLALKLPRFALQFVFEAGDASLGIGRPHFTAELKALMCAAPHITAEYFVRWGMLEKQDPELLHMICQRALKIRVENIGRSHMFNNEVFPFKILIPKYLGLLPLLAASLCVWARGPKEIDSSANVILVGKSRNENVLNAYGLTLPILRKTALDASHENIVRAGALALFWIGLEGAVEEVDLEVEKNLYENLVDDRSSSWLTAALVLGILMRTSESNKKAVSIVNSILARNFDGSVQDEVELVLRVWRERSNAPITTKNAMSKWLGYEDGIPQYAR